MNLEETVKDIKNGGVFISDYKEIKKVCLSLGTSILPNAFKLAKLIEIKKIGDEDDYLVQPCNDTFYKDTKTHIKNGFTFYFGSSKKGKLTSVEDIQELNDMETNSNNNVIEVFAQQDEYIYICFPAEKGTIKLTVNGFEGGFIKDSIDFFGDKLDVYRSVNDSLGLTKIYIN